MTAVRAIFSAAKVEGAPAPYDTLHLKVFYPAQPTGSELERNLGLVSAAVTRSPFPVVILFNGINCGPELYQWLAVALAERGWGVVTFAWVAENLPGMVALTPGVDLTRLAPQHYGHGPTALALPALLAALTNLQAAGMLAGHLDLSRLVIGGHSAGGRVAIESASPEFFPPVRAAFAYGAHTGAIVQMGYAPGTILPLPDALPLLLMGGTQDGVIAHSSDRYGVTWERATTPVERTFHEGLAGGRGDSYLVLLEGANHFVMAHPLDATTGRAFLDLPATQPAERQRQLIVEAIALFLAAHVNAEAAAREQLRHLLTTAPELIAAATWK